jgi:hypothetical protein
VPENARNGKCERMKSRFTAAKIPDSLALVFSDGV